MSRSVPMFVAGEWLFTDATEPNTNPATGEILDHICQADESACERAIVKAQQAFQRMRLQPAHTRANTCTRIADLLRERSDDMAEMISGESGKPIRFARGEVERAIFTFRLGAEQAGMMSEGRPVSLDRFQTGAGRRGWMRRFPIGPVFALSPFNFPLNLTAHKLAPAFACGCPVLLKPSPYTPQTCLLLAKICEDAGIIDGALSVLPCSIPRAEALARDERFKAITFTGSAKVGWHLKNLAGRKRVMLELGNNSANVVHSDAKDMDFVVDRLAIGGFAAAGQICIKVQRLYVHRPSFELFAARFIEAVRMLKTGDPFDDDTVVGPMISEAAAERVEKWISAAVGRGARVLTGARRKGVYVEPTVLTNVPFDDPCVQDEVFGPVVILEPYDTFEQVIEAVNSTPFGLQAALFTQDVSRIFQAFDQLEVGGLIVNDYSAFRVDNMPYGGVKASGFGREGLEESMLEMTEPRLLVLNTP
ncbi:MAG: aldehyde dehydrogenase family protein [Planctomycetota bacterium]